MILPLPSNAGKARRHAPVTGTARKGRRTKELVKRLKAGDIAFIDHVDLDAIAATSLVDAHVVAVIDSVAPISGKYPNRGPHVLVSAGVALYQLRDPALFDRIHDGKPITIGVDGSLSQGGDVITDAVTQLTPSDVEGRMEGARVNLGHELEEFAANTLRYVREEKSLLIEPVEIPSVKGVRTIANRHVVIVVRGEGYREDLMSISSYIRDVRPVLIGVDGGADVLREFGFKPDIILGDMDSVSDESLKCGAKLIVHAYAGTGKAPGLDRVTSLGMKAETFPVPGTSEDAAMLLAHEKGAKLIVAVGTHSNLEDFLDKGRAGMASTFLVRLRVGSRLVDARGVSQLHRRSATRGEVFGLLLSGGAAIAAIVSQSAFVQSFLSFAQHWWRLRWH